MVAKHIIFTGRVQGVGFRFTALRIAQLHQLKGYVHNSPDGSVEMLVQGYTEDVDGCIADIKDSFAGYLREVKIEKVAHNPKYTDFKIAF